MARERRQRETEKDKITNNMDIVQNMLRNVVTCVLSGSRARFQKWGWPALGINSVLRRNPSGWSHPTSGEFDTAVGLGDTLKIDQFLLESARLPTVRGRCLIRIARPNSKGSGSDALDASR